MINKSKIEVYGTIQGDGIRVTGRNRNDLPEMIAVLRQIKRLEVTLHLDKFCE